MNATSVLSAVASLRMRRRTAKEKEHALIDPAKLTNNQDQAGTFKGFLQVVPKALHLEILAAGLALELLALSIPVFSQVILDKVVVHNSASTLHVLAAGMLLVACFEGVLTYLYARQVGIFSGRIDQSLTAAVTTRLFQLPLSYFERYSKGEVMGRLREIAEIRAFLSAVTITAAIDLCFAALVFLIIWAYSAQLAAVVLASIPFLAGFSLLVRPIVRRRFLATSRAAAAFNTAIAEGVQKIGAIKTLGLEDHWEKRWADAHQQVVTTSLRICNTSAMEDAAFRVIQRLVVVAVLLVGTQETLSGQLTFGQLIACYMFSLRVLGPSTRIFQIVLGFQKIREAQHHIDSLMGEPVESFGTQRPPRCGPSVELRDVSFTYPSSTAPVLRCIDLFVAGGCTVAIVGRSGSGKSTIARMIQGHCKPNTGQVLIDGAPLADLSKEALRHHILLLTQEAHLFRGSIRDAILAGRLANNERLLSACEVAGAMDFIRQLPQGFDTALDDGASQLSTGQRQRVALARAVYAKPTMLILDEATNALDLETELPTLRRLRLALADATVMLITHREQVLGEVDFVLTVQDGHLVTRPPRKGLVGAAA